MNTRKLLLATLLLFLSINFLVAQVNLPSAFPDRVVLNLTENPATSVAVTWRTDVSVSEGFCEMQLAAEGPVKKEDSKTFRAKTTTIKYEYRNEPVIEANQHSFVFTDLIPGKKYIYRVGAGDYWSEWFEYKAP